MTAMFTTISAETAETAEKNRCSARSACSALYVVLMIFVSFVAFATAQSSPDVTGEWEAQYVTPLGPQELKIYLQQEGPRISGHTTSEFGEFQVRGSISGTDVKFSWTEVDGGKNVAISVTGKIDGDKITGTATVGERGTGAFNAERTGS
jgi:hypothetical protein